MTYCKVCFYIVAHADDWQLFMNPHVYNDLVSPTCKVIFIITTAGDAGMKSSYWQAREEGLKSSIRFCIAPLSPLKEIAGESMINQHNISWYSINNTTTYFLRLPDGNIHGNGFAENNYQSLSKFNAKKIQPITTVDNSAVYPDWRGFVSTLEYIVDAERKNIDDAWLHYLNPDMSVNCNDHQDHIATGQAIRNMRIINNISQLLFVGYATRNSHDNLAAKDFFWKAGMFAAYETAVYNACGYSTLAENPTLYAAWCGSNALVTSVSIEDRFEK